MPVKGLGKGLGALLGEEAAQPRQESGVILVPISHIEPNMSQPRKAFDDEALNELADSIRRHGVLQPLAVRRLKTGFYQIIAGERRWRASRMAGLTELPAMVLEADDRRTMELSLIENLQREDLNPIEEAEGFRSLIDEYGLTQEEAAARVGRSRPALSNSMRLLGLPAEIKDMICTGTLSSGHARAFLQLSTHSEMMRAAQHVFSKGLSVRQTEAYVKKLLTDAAKPQTDRPQPNYLEDTEKKLSERFGRKVRIVSGRDKGRFEFEFYGQDDLELLIRTLESLQA